MVDLDKKIRNSVWRTQERFATECNISQTTISQYVRGLKTPSAGHAAIMAEVLERGVLLVTIESLLEQYSPQNYAVCLARAEKRIAVDQNIFLAEIVRLLKKP